jgi:hypothetical protein
MADTMDVPETVAEAGLKAKLTDSELADLHARKVSHTPKQE